ncbi:hypothetical protein SteCoe_17971 [Stentor coeruleus]|uniref:Uncharacterized protein n=1 Tax=Stentor coeruleus TaxID=5963 RepID=A0A1R2BXP0_9CILI|nr:hypothetical protein SteCoe_17971 [Stentor coeruleus]
MIISLLFMAGFLIKSSSSSSSCSCDITSSSCDPYCCCDSSCLSDYTDTWDKKCLEGTILPKSDICSMSSSHTLEAGWRGMKVATDVINRALCIAFDNSPSDYNNFDSITAGTTGRVYNTTSSKMNQTLSGTDEIFTAGSFLHAQMGSSNMKLWTLPTPDPYGKCWFSSPVRFMESLEKNTCSYTLSSASDCSQLYISVFTKDLNIATNNDLTKTASVNNILYIKRTEKGIETVSKLELSSSISGTTCTNIVVSADYTLITNDNQNSVSEVNIQLTVMDLDLSNEIDIPITTQVIYLTNTDDIIYKSGNPGYQIGKLLNTGYMSSATTIVYYESGFQIPGVANTGKCQDGTFSKAPYLRFGHDLIVTCYVEMDFSEFDSKCLGGISNSMYFNKDLLSLIGKYGHVNYTYIDDWIFIDNGTNSATEGSITSSVCEIPNVYAYYITYTSIGNARNPQYKIIYAKREFISKTKWIFRTQDKTAKQKFFFTLSVNFIEYTKEIYSYFPPAPNPLPVMPDDILYPFKISGAEVLVTVLLFYLV